MYRLLGNITFRARIPPQSIREMTAGQGGAGERWGDCYLISLTENELAST